VGVVEQGKEILGYGSLFLKSEYLHFSNIPEINNVWIYEEYGEEVLSLPNDSLILGAKDVGVCISISIQIAIIH
jgi:hypothetical protein